MPAVIKRSIVVTWYAYYDIVEQYEKQAIKQCRAQFRPYSIPQYEGRIRFLTRRQKANTALERRGLC